MECMIVDLEQELGQPYIMGERNKARDQKPTPPKCTVGSFAGTDQAKRQKERKEIDDKAPRGRERENKRTLSFSKPFGEQLR